MNKTVLILLIATGYFALVFFGLFFIPESIQYSKEGSTNTLPFMTVTFGIPMLLFLWMMLSSKENKTPVMLVVITSLVGFPAVITQDYYRLEQMEEELKADGKLIKGVVVERAKKSGKGYNGYQIVLRFTVDDVEYFTFKQEDWEDQYRMGDTLEVRYLPRNPEISRVPVFEDED